MTWPMYELAAALNFSDSQKAYKPVRVRERTVLRHGSGVRVLSDRVVTRKCRTFKGKMVLV